MNLKRPRQRRALATVITSAIMMSAVCTLGSAGVVWSQSSLSVQRVDMTNTVSDYIGKLNESLVFEYVYCTSDPCNQIKIVLTNVGHVGIDATEVIITEKSSGFNKIHTISNGQILPEQSIEITIDDANFSSYPILDVMVKTNRGNMIMTQTNT